jgi:hypothetical protein
MRLVAIGFAVLLLTSAVGSAQTETGTICVAARADDPFRGQVIPPTGPVSSYGLRVKIDKRPAVAWPQRESLKIDGLDLNERHPLAILDAHDKPVESLWFRFATFKTTHLCMDYDGYQGIGLQPDGKHCPWCKCKYTD